ncbi:uncharacterized protein K441DRAFT_693173 [Cenococcum geophilum 1.58]|uniref:uncharacterized protein n=1 Tax=Cenococcum geophilum 1.58 TaxID=794803 RepID=UPI00358F74A3|nr:hypothetical protein K441DRAFT_693173 [Cenococcum geophilum 1.58]
MAQSELYLFSKQFSRPFLGSDVLFPTLPRQSGQRSGDNTCHLNFLYFCATAQKLLIDFLPISWQPRLGLIGCGGTAKIHQSLLSLEFRLAFKAIDMIENSHARSAIDEERIYAALMSELRPFFKKSVWNCLFIHHPVGICWNVDKQNLTVDPVLVYENMHHGDMQQFFTSGQGREFTLSDRISMCRNVAEALKTLHACHIIHGDIKPQNILITDLNGQALTAQLSDFGYSTEYEDDSAITVPCSKPWNAPEVCYESNLLSPSEAIKTDIFSFGMLCAWVLFREELSNQFPIALDLADNPTLEGAGKHNFRTIDGLKTMDKMRPFCRSQVGSLESPTSGQKEGLMKLFEMTLAPDPVDRATDFQVVSEVLKNIPDGIRSNPEFDVTEWIPTEEIIPGTIEDHENEFQQHHDFQISESILQFVKIDRRVREHIMKCILHEARYNKCLRCQKNSAFQLALCFKIGFGIAASERSSQEWLQNSGRAAAELQSEVQLISQISPTSDPFLYHSRFLTNLNNEGYLRPVDYFDAYKADYSLDQIIQGYEREISDLECCLGSQSLVSVGMKSTFASVLKRAGDYAKAADLQEEQVQWLENHPEFGPQHLDTHVLWSELSGLYRLVHMQAQLLQDLGSFEEAERLYKSVLSQRESIFGKLHEATLNVMSDLGAFYIYQANYDQAQEYCEEELRLSEKMFGPHHYSTLISLNNLALLYLHKEDVKLAKELLDRAMPEFRLVIGDSHPLRSAALANCGTLYLGLEMYDESLGCYDEALNMIQETLGPNHPVALQIFLGKARLYEKKGDFEQAKNMFEICIHGGEQMFGLEHPETLVSLHSYSDFLLEHSKLHEAETCYRSLLYRQEHRVGGNQVTLLATLSGLGNVLELLGSDEAEKIYGRALDLSIGLLGMDTEETWSCMQNLATYVQDKGRHDESEHLHRRIIEAKRARFGNCCVEVLENIDDLHKALVCQDKLDEAEEVQREALEYSRKCLGPDDPDILERLWNLASVLNQRGNLVEAESTYRECITISTKAFGEGGEKTLELSAILAWVMEREGKHVEARQCIAQALEKCELGYGQSNPTFIRVGTQAAGILFRQGDREEAISISGLVLEICRSTLGPDDEETQAAEHNHSLYSKQE